MTRKIEIYPLNRVEGDLEITLELEDDVVINAQSAGIMYRGFENFMVGRSPLDGLVITPRICGICSTSHLYAAARALDMLYNVDVPPRAKWIRSVSLMTEHLQNDFRHAFLLFMPDFTHARYQKEPLYPSMVKRYAPIKGSSVRQAIDETRKILEIISILGGQWPHSSFMVPGGVVSMPSNNELNRCTYLLQNFKKWYERQVLGCSLERWHAVQSKADLIAWLKESKTHLHSDLGYYIRFSTSTGLVQTGKGHGNYISFGVPGQEPKQEGKGENESNFLTAGGFYTDNRLSPLDQENIMEDISHSWFTDSDNSQHPYYGQSVPYATGSESRRYSWAKAPRYKGLPAEAGPLSEMIVSANPLFCDFMRLDGPSTFLRELARLVRATIIIPLFERCIEEAMLTSGQFYRDHDDIEQQLGHGLIDAPRGALGHWVTIKDSKISSYQIITPTAWNASPRDANDIRGPIEEALIGTIVKDHENPLEIHHVVRSFDPCLVCTVHAIKMR